jgi:uncharacterized delta-60 repeat protein
VSVSGARAGAGDLDPSFGIGGKVVTDFEGSFDRARAVAVQPDGKTVAAGAAGVPGGGLRFGVARYAVDGQLDPSFGNGGRVTIGFGGLADEATGVAVQPDGRIVVGGTSNFGRIALARLNPDGSPDTTFGSNGTVVVDAPTGSSEQLAALALAPDGKIVTAGNRIAPQVFLVARFGSNGALDASFGSGGKVTTSFGTAFALGRAVAVQPDGRIIAAGTQGGGTQSFALARYNVDGSLDSGFGSAGRVTTDFDFFAGVGGVAVTPAGQIVAAGSTSGATTRFALARYNSNGDLDPTFGAGGKVTSFAAAGASALALEPDGKIVAAGFATVGASGDRDFAVARYNVDGSIDATFGDGGLVTTDFGGINDFAFAMANAPTGQVVVGGATSTNDFGLARYTLTADNTPPIIGLLVGGTLGLNGWYTSDVAVSWSVSDPDSAISAQVGCSPSSITNDTSGITLTCTATSAGGTSSRTITIRRDATPPTLSCAATPASLWPPSGQLVPVAASIDVRDDLSGARGFVLEGVDGGGGDAASDVIGWTIGEPDTSGFLRAERPGFDAARTYRLIYFGSDNAGNKALCVVEVAVPHDQRP